MALQNYSLTNMTEEIQIHDIEDMGVKELLIRLDERTKNIQQSMNLLPQNYVQKQEFLPVRNVVYGFVSLILVTIVGAILALILKK